NRPRLVRFHSWPSHASLLVAKFKDADARAGGSDSFFLSSFPHYLRGKLTQGSKTAKQPGIHTMRKRRRSRERTDTQTAKQAHRDPEFAAPASHANGPGDRVNERWC